ncbi:glutaredoxin-C8 isoform X1 [Typha latifolia]|uniref:glutaredoxin-C8 isoform X1 n=1 Tax=Typha latifolia TaxID=4733 RepID=UPI003C2E49CE
MHIIEVTSGPKYLNLIHKGRRSGGRGGLPTAASIFPPNPPSRSVEATAMAVFGRRIGMAAVALVAVAAASLFASSSEAANKVSFVKKTVSSHDIVIFSKSYCPYCKRAKAVFKELNKEPYVVELDKRDLMLLSICTAEDGWDIQDALSEVVGRRTVPQVFIHGKHLGGSDDTVEAYTNGKLSKLLNIDPKDDL